MSSFHVIIPARFASSRFPGKALAMIDSKPMIEHVYNRAQQSGATSVTIATDDERIFAAAKKFNAEVCMTKTSHQSGTDRIAEVIDVLDLAADAIIVNVQGDEPLIPPAVINQVANDLFMHPEAQVATLCEPLARAEQLFAANIAKVVVDANNFALFFSRAPIPWDRDHFPLALETNLMSDVYFRHLGIYAYRASYLRKFVTLKPCVIEQLECLEQLRMLYCGAKIYVGVAYVPSMIGVDTLQDLAKVQQLFLESQKNV